MNIFFHFFFFRSFFLWIVCIIFFIGFQVCMALAVYYDGQSKMNRNSVVWAVLCGLLGIIPMIIYLCVRNNPSMVPIYCSQCGRAHVISEPCCPFCHQENPYSRIEVANPPDAGTAQKGQGMPDYWDMPACGGNPGDGHRAGRLVL